MVRELDFSRMTLRLVEESDSKGGGKDEHVIAKLSGNTIDTLKRCFVSFYDASFMSRRHAWLTSVQYEPTQLVLKDNDGHAQKVKVSLRYIPVQMQLDPSESINNQGNLRVEILDATDLPAADRNGQSDPYCKFYLNDKDVHKTKTQKKTLHPAWNEYFEVSVPSRTAARFQVKVYDWDFGDKADFLGKADINLNIIEPFNQQEVVLGLDGKSGTVRLKLLFKPDYVTRARQGSSTFHGTFAAPGKIVGAPVKGVGKGAVFVGGNVAKGASFLGRGFRRRKSIVQTEAPEDDRAVQGGIPPVPSIPDAHMANGDSNSHLAGPSTPHMRSSSSAAHSIAQGNGAAASGVDTETGTAIIHITSASRFPEGTNLRVHVRMDTAKGIKEVHKTKAVKVSDDGDAPFAGENEIAEIACAPNAQFRLLVKDHSFFGPDKELGEKEISLGDGENKKEEVVIGDGVLYVSSRFVSTVSGDGGGGVGGSGGYASSISPSHTGKFSRRSFMGGRRERSMTPTA